MHKAYSTKIGGTSNSHPASPHQQQKCVCGKRGGGADCKIHLVCQLLAAPLGLYLGTEKREVTTTKQIMLLSKVSWFSYPCAITKNKKQTNQNKTPNVAVELQLLSY